MKKLFIALFTSSLLFASAVTAQPVKIVSPYTAGGLIDRVGRDVQTILNENTKHTFVTDYRIGAGGKIASTHVAQEKDNRTVLLIQSGPALITTSLDKNSAYRVSDFMPVAYIGSAPFVLIANRDNHINSIEKLLATNSQAPVFFSSSGVKTGTHLAGESLKLATNKNLIHVPVQGEKAAMVEVLANRVSFAFVSASTIVGHEDKLVVVAAAQNSRIKQLPNVPTLKELRIEGFDNGPVWAGLYANTTADKALIKEIQTVLTRELAKQEIRDNFEKTGVVVSTDRMLKLGEISNAEEKRIQQILVQGNIE